MLEPMGGRWVGSMGSALVATLGHPAWWAMALAAFLVRGGFVLILVPIITAPSPAAIATAIAPTVDALAFGGLTLDRVVVGSAIAILVLAVVAAAGLAGSWLDLALVRDAVEDEDLDLRWSAGHASARRAFSLRVTAHVPTILALAYGSVRLTYVTYDELLSPGDASSPFVVRILAAAPEVSVLLVLAWLLGEAAGGLAARHAAAGMPVRGALRHGFRQVVSRRGLATLAITHGVLTAVAAPFVLGVGAAWGALGFWLADGTNLPVLAGWLLVFVASWTLGLLVLAAALAWRATAWTAEAAPTFRLAPASEPLAAPAAEVAAG